MGPIRRVKERGKIRNKNLYRTRLAGEVYSGVGVWSGERTASHVVLTAGGGEEATTISNPPNEFIEEDAPIKYILNRH